MYLLLTASTAPVSSSRRGSRAQSPCPSLHTSEARAEGEGVNKLRLLLAIIISTVPLPFDTGGRPAPDTPSPAIVELVSASIARPERSVKAPRNPPLASTGDNRSAGRRASHSPEYVEDIVRLWRREESAFISA